MMNCTELDKNILGYLEGSLVEQKMSLMEKHLEGCKRCQDYLDFVKGTLGQIEIEKETGASDSFSREIFSRIEKAPEVKVINLRRNFILVVSAAAVLFFAIITGVKLGRYSSSEYYSTFSEIDQDLFFVDDISLEPVESYFLVNNIE